MSACIAKRELMYCVRGSDERKHFVIRLFAPFDVLPGTVNFNFDEGVAGCKWEADGLPETIEHTAYGADSLQALQLAGNLDGVLKSYRRKYDFYFPSGEPYFDE